jgi:hypothetical protein
MHDCAGPLVDSVGVTLALNSRNHACCLHRFLSGIRVQTDLRRETKPKAAGNFDLRSSFCAGLTGRFAVSVAQVSDSCNGVDGLLLSCNDPSRRHAVEK